MNRQNFLALIDELLELEPGTVNGSEQLDQLDWNSLAVVGFIALADEQLGVSVSPARLAKCRVVNDLYALLSAGASAA